MIKAQRDFSKDPSFYFSDIDYTDYRELICFERPACFVLHYYFGVDSMRSWLFDRFAFNLSNGSFEHRFNALADFMRSSGLVTIENYDLARGDFKSFAASLISQRSSLVIPIETRFGDAVAITSVMVEGLEGDIAFHTCLRGDQFFVRKPVPLDELVKLLSTQDGKVECHKIHVTNDVLKLRGLQHHEIWKRFDLSIPLNNAFVRYFGAPANANRGKEQLLTFVEATATDCTQYATLVSQGFSNVLLAQIFWPMLFAYSPFVVFLRNARRQGMLPEGSLWSSNEKLDACLKKTSDASQVVTNLGLMFGKSPKQREYDRFRSSLLRLCEAYGEIESDFVSTASRFLRA